MILEEFLREGLIGIICTFIFGVVGYFFGEEIGALIGGSLGIIILIVLILI